LGRMFQKRTDELSHPTNNNEYFIDRDGYVFRYVLQYYRTGKMIYPDRFQSFGISKEELLIEFDFFQIPIPRLEDDEVKDEDETQPTCEPNDADNRLAMARISTIDSTMSDERIILNVGGIKVNHNDSHKALISRT